MGDGRPVTQAEKSFGAITGKKWWPLFFEKERSKEIKK
jgi:hypothetical protein